MADNSRAINRVFTRGVIGDLLQNGTNEVFDYVVQRYVNDPEHKTHGEIISEIYAHLGKEHRNEYYYMNTLLNKLLIGIHSVNTTTALSQVRIGCHIADFVMINGEGRVYEIKSDLDNFGRLHDQLSDYFKAFSNVSVLTTIHEFERVERILAEQGDMGESVGIYVVNDNNVRFNLKDRRYPRQFDDYLDHSCIKERRAPRQFDGYLDHSCIFKLLRKREYENVILQQFEGLPQVAPVFHFKACLEKFQQIPIKTAQDLAFKELKKRNKISKTAFESIQPELKSTVYFSGLTRRLPDLEQLLKTNYRR
ncbi:sce7726 family protein [Stenoxybacter acetivorans]|uniref:sce7726 family protein n=1 Tax=Stenoxybacter acetivorans TaxID=422441 RepID=UPI000566BF8A|nr:sce7726 family protein [Stenoxybacter acetivorans]